MTKRLFYVAIIVVVFIGMFVGANSCQQPAPPKAIVKVIDESGNPVSDAMVVIKAPNSDSLHTVIYLLNETKQVADTQRTDSEGKSFYDFKYKAIYRVEVTKEKDRQYPLGRRGVGVLTLEEDKTIEVTIKINEQTVF
jgi:hypothetical protein